MGRYRGQHLPLSVADMQRVVIATSENAEKVKRRAPWDM